MINPNGDDFVENDPWSGATPSGEEENAPESARAKVRQTARRVSQAAGQTWQQARAGASTARERTELFLRENPVPTVLGALMVGLAIGLAIRYASSSREREIAIKSPWGNAHLGAPSLSFFWPFVKQVRRTYEDSAEAVKGGVKEGVERLRDIDVDRYVKPLRKRWKSWID
jgi:ElaB/YqjD/DUF883 family membrane-anchored ribosome-binding protein